MCNMLVAKGCGQPTWPVRKCIAQRRLMYRLVRARVRTPCLCVTRSSSIIAETAEYRSRDVEGRWSGQWAWSESKGSKYYMLSMFPYPSGRLHMGHVRVYTISDTLARYHRMTGHKVLHPMGWDAFGLPAENAAIDRGVDPLTWTTQNIATMRGQLDKMGCHFDWTKEVTTCSPDYYRWTQWLFLQLYHRGLAYRKKAVVNWDPEDQTVLANEQVDEAGRSWRSGALVQQRQLDQWFFKITDYADRLLEGLDDLDWPDNVKAIQAQWIGRSKGAHFDFKLTNGDQLRVFTTCPHTLYGVNYLAVSPQHPLTQTLSSAVRNEIAGWTCSAVPKNGVFTGVHGSHPLTGELLPVYVADYVLSDYGTEAVMGVPGHDERDRCFAAEHSLSIPVIVQNDYLINSQQFSGMSVAEGDLAVTEHAQSLGVGGHMTTYKLRDWLISRQRYWGAPIPILYCDKCGTVPVPEEQLPVTLPDNVAFTGRGPSSLATNKEWARASCGRPDCCAQRDTDTMDTFVDSSWYYLRFASNQEHTKAFSSEVNDWMPVDTYVGGIEHAHLHLLYARFINHVLYDLGLLATKEPFQRLIAQGMVQGRTYRERGTGRYLRPEEDRQGSKVTWEKMSKSKFNGVDPSAILERYGADSARLYMLFKAPPELDIQWDDQAIQGVHRWLHRMWRLTHSHIHASQVGGANTKDSRDQIVSATHKAIKHVTGAMDGDHTLNTALPELMILSNELRDHSSSSHMLYYHEALCSLVTLLAPMAPHIAAELWEGLTQARTNYSTATPLKGGVFEQSWPQWSEDLLDLSTTRQVVIQVNGRKRGVLEVPARLIGHTDQLTSQVLDHAVDIGLIRSHDHMERVVTAPTGTLVNIVTSKH